MQVEEIKVPYKEYLTYCRIVNPDGKKTPLLLLHGGPGSTHNSFELFDTFAFSSDRPVIMYDQIGCGLSSIPNDKPELYCSDTWIDELQNLIGYLRLDEFHLLGHSWGGMLAQLYCLKTGSKGVKTLILSSTLSSASLWKEETHRLIRSMSKEDQKAIEEAEKNNDYTTPKFQEALDRYLKMTVSDYSKDDPAVPECLRRKKISGNVAYNTAWGPSEFQPLGNLKDYEITSQLKGIRLPVLLLFGEKDESTKAVNEAMYDALTNASKEMIEIPKARHMTYFENSKCYFEVLSRFLEHGEHRNKIR